MLAIALRRDNLTVHPIVNCRQYRRIIRPREQIPDMVVPHMPRGDVSLLFSSPSQLLRATGPLMDSGG